GGVAYGGADGDVPGGVPGRDRQPVVGGGLLGHGQLVDRPPGQAVEVQPHPGAGLHPHDHVPGDGGDVHRALPGGVDPEVTGGAADGHIPARPADARVPAGAFDLHRSAYLIHHEVTGGGVGDQPATDLGGAEVTAGAFDGEIPVDVGQGGVAAGGVELGGPDPPHYF